MMNERKTITMYAVSGYTYDRIGRKVDEIKAFCETEEEAKKMCKLCGYTYYQTEVYADTFVK